MSTETKKYTCKFTQKNEYVQRFLNAGNGLWDAMIAMKNGDSSRYKEHFAKITKGIPCAESRVEFWGKEVKASQNIRGKEPPRAMLHRNVVGAGKSMNLDHSKLIDGDVFLVDGNHRITAAMIRGEEPVVVFDDSKPNMSPEWRAVLNAKSDLVYRVKHQPHPHPLLWDLSPFRTMDSCKARYEVLATSGIKNTYEVGCADGVGVWLLKQAGVNARGSEINGPARTLAESLTKGKIDPAATPETLPDVECLILYSVLYHLLSNKSSRDAWIHRIKQYPCVALELSTDAENKEKSRYQHMIEHAPLDWWPNRKLLYTDTKHANRETWLLWK